jgi:hypothetical protein
MKKALPYLIAALFAALITLAIYYQVQIDKTLFK